MTWPATATGMAMVAVVVGAAAAASAFDITASPHSVTKAAANVIH